MLRRLLAVVTFLALPLLLAAVLLALAQTHATPVMAPSAESAQLHFGDMGLAGIASAADFSSEEPEPLQATAPATRTATERPQWLSATHSAWPLRVPDEPLRPPLAQPLIDTI